MLLQNDIIKHYFYRLFIIFLLFYTSACTLRNNLDRDLNSIGRNEETAGSSPYKDASEHFYNLSNIIDELARVSEAAVENLYETRLNQFQNRVLAIGISDIAFLILDFTKSENPFSVGTTFRSSPSYPILYESLGVLRELNFSIRSTIGKSESLYILENFNRNYRDEIRDLCDEVVVLSENIAESIQLEYIETTASIVRSSVASTEKGVLKQLLTQNSNTLRDISVLRSLAAAYKFLPKAYESLALYIEGRFDPFEDANEGLSSINDNLRFFSERIAALANPNNSQVVCERA